MLYPFNLWIRYQPNSANVLFMNTHSGQVVKWIGARSPSHVVSGDEHDHTKFALEMWKWSVPHLTYTWISTAMEIQMDYLMILLFF